MRDKLRNLTMLACLALLAGCAGLTLGVPTSNYAVSLCADGAVIVPCKSLGTLPVPEGSLVQIVVALAAPELAKSTALKGCKFTTYPEALDGQTITVTATATCTLNGVEVPENLRVSLTPAGAA